MSEINPKSEIRFRRFGILTIASVFFLIFVGGLVRSTGSGMGCPDWPKCFGQWVPPTDINELPTDYKEKFKVAGHEIADFDVTKTWIEYVNRLIGVLTGFFIFLTMFFAVPYLKKDKSVFWLSFLAFILVGFQGWIGSKVVSTNLAHWMVTIHMLIALVIVGLLIYTITRSQDFTIELKHHDKSLFATLIILNILTCIQIISGTQVREAIDQTALATGESLRGEWINLIVEKNYEGFGILKHGTNFLFHRSFSLINLIFTILMIRKFRKTFDRHSILYKMALIALILVAVQIFSGKVLDTFGFPRYVQSLHLFVGSLIAGNYIFITIVLYSKSKLIKAT